MCDSTSGPMLGVTPREWVAAFYVIVAIAIVAILGLRPVAALVLVSMAAMTLIASRACSGPDFNYWNGLRLVASINPTGETLIGQIFVLPALAIASLYSWILGITWVLGGREWPRRRWLNFLRRYRELVIRMRPKD
jgi:hypothetical protein